MIISVNGFEDAKSYPVMYNNSEILMDNNKDVFYVKAVDSLGKVSVDTYRFEKIENEKPISVDDFVTREQFSEFTSKIDLLLAQLAAQTVATPAQNAPSVASVAPATPNEGGTPSGKQRAEK